MRHNLFFLVMLLGKGASVLGDPQIRLKTQPYAGYYLLVKQQQDMYRDLCLLVHDDQAYQTEQNRAMIRRLVDQLAQFAEPDATKRTMLRVGIGVDAVAVRIPYIAGAATKQDLAWMLFGQAVSHGDEAGIRFLQEEYALDLNTGTDTGRSAFQWIGKGTTYRQKPAETIQLLLDLGLQPKWGSVWDSEGQNVLHRAAHCLIENHIGSQDPARAFDEQLRAGFITLPEGATKEQELKHYTQARHVGMQDWAQAIRLLLASGIDPQIVNIDGKDARAIIESCVCKGQEELCKELCDLFSAREQAAAKIQAETPKS